MSAAGDRAGKRLPPGPVLAVIIGLLVLVPLGSWVLVGLRNWGYGGSPAALLDGP